MLILQKYKLKDEFSSHEKQKLYDEAFRILVHIKCENGVWSPETTNTYRINFTLNFTDNFGEWEKDLMFGHLEIYLRLGNGVFPKSWKTDMDKVWRVVYIKQIILNYPII